MYIHINVYIDRYTYIHKYIYVCVNIYIHIYIYINETSKRVGREHPGWVLEGKHINSLSNLRSSCWAFIFPCC